jgi:16S rRNA (guanine527-N7)-methyltransferase
VSDQLILSRLSRLSADLLGIPLTPAQLRGFDWYSAELQAWNAHTNVTAITEPEVVEMRHFADSLSCLLAMKPVSAGQKVIDVGTGAGFPGLPLKMVCPQIDLTLVEATGKKIEFLRHIISGLKLEGVSVIHERAETIGQMPEHREHYDRVLARAVAGMPVLAELLLPLAKIGGRVIAQKGESAHAEAVEADRAIHLLGGRLTQITPVEIPAVAETHYLVEIEKIAATPPQYPRRPGMPAKRPLG